MVALLPSSQVVPGSGPLGQRSSASQVPSPSASANVPAHWQLASYTSPVVQASLSLHAVPGTAGPPGTPSQSLSSKVPVHWQSRPITSLMVALLPSSQVVPGSGPLGQRSFASQVPSPSASWKMWDTPAIASQASNVQGSPSSTSTGVPTQVQLASITSPVVQTVPSSQGVPGSGPPGHRSK